MTFDLLGLDPRILRKIKHLNFNEPTEIQKNTIPLAISGKDILASSKTGSGKTLAFILPILQRMYKSKPFKKRDARVLIVAPTRELARQIFAQLRLFISGTPYDAALILGGENFNDQEKQLRNKDPMIVIGTPGRIVDHIHHRSLFLDGLEMLILDEADRIMDLGFKKEVEMINHEADHRKRQTLFFSATLDDPEIKILASEILNSPKEIILEKSEVSHADIEEKFIFSDNVTQKEKQLTHLLETSEYEQVIIFTATRDDTSRIADLLNTMNLKAVALSGKLSQTQRNMIISQFERHVFKILVTTDVASRGLDIDKVGIVVNFDLPKHSEEYVHRIGRTGRAGNKGRAFSFVGPKDWQSYIKLRTFLSYKLKFIELPGLIAKFKGYRLNVNKEDLSKKKKQLTSNSKVADTSKKTKLKKSFDKSFLDNQDVGDNVFIPKKK